MCSERSAARRSASLCGRGGAIMNGTARPADQPPPARAGGLGRARRAGLADGAAQHVDQPLDRQFDVGKRLADEIVAAAEARLGAALEAAERRHEDHRRLGVERHGAQAFAKLEAVHAGHFHVEEHQVEGLFLQAA